MLIESTLKEFFEYKGKRSNLVLYPGRPVRVPNVIGQKIIIECGGKVRMVSPDWVEGWQGVAQMTLGVTSEDGRFGAITQIIDFLDQAFIRDDWDSFVEHVERLKYLMGTPTTPLDRDPESRHENDRGR